MLTLHDIPGDHIAQIPVEPCLAATATVLVGIWYAPYDCVVKSVKFLPTLATTGNNSNTKNLNVIHDDGVTPTEIGNYDLPTGTNLVAGTPVTLDVDSDGVALAAGESLRFQVEKVGTGVLVGAGTWLVTYVGG